jgi:hypothetical protein
MDDDGRMPEEIVVAETDGDYAVGGHQALHRRSLPLRSEVRSGASA